MGRYLGLDVGAAVVRVAVVRTSYRRVAVEALAERERASGTTLAETIRELLAPISAPGDAIATAIDGERTFLRDLSLPPTALKQLADVLPFEIEAQLPVDLADIVYDHQLRKRATADAPLRVTVAAARTEDVRARIELVRDATGLEPEKVGVGAFPLAALAPHVPALRADAPVAVLCIEETRSELVLLQSGEPVLARTLSRGTAGLPESAAALAREVRQSFAGWRSTGGDAPTALWLAGPGASAPGAIAYFQAELEVPIDVLPAPEGIELPPELAPELARYARSLGLALGLAPKARTLDLRRGPLAYQRGYDFLREKIPVLTGLVVVVVVSFLFSTWAELRSLSRQQETLENALASLSQNVLGEETRDPRRVTELLERSSGTADDDPMPHVDAFDVMVQLSRAVPEGTTHDVEELDVQRGHVAIHGIVPTIPDAQAIAATLKNTRCFQDVKVVKTNQVVGEDRQKYVIELDLRCPSEKDEKKGATPAGSGSAQPASSAGDKP
jgi:general secretion pathway protein L